MQADAQQKILEEQKDAENELKDALKERSKAYADLHQAKITGDAKKYGAELEKVALAEQAVADAQKIKNEAAAKEVKPKNYSQIFAEQIAAAKTFATNVKQLVQAGLGKAGLAQILDLGPVAGSQVAKDLLAGTGGISISGLNADLADIEATGTAAGMAIPGMTEALGAEAGRAGANQYYITIQAGVSSPTDIAKTVETVLKDYGGTQGGIAVATKPPKAAPAKKKKKK
jgi:malonyl CoA-acyl carrier protein transacylase